MQVVDSIDALAIKQGYQINEYPEAWRIAKYKATTKDKHKYREETAYAYACRLFLGLGGVKSNDVYEDVEINVLEGEQ